jgi:hypothetical protein
MNVLTKIPTPVETPNRTTESHLARAADITRHLAAGLSVELLVSDDEWLPIASARAEDGIVWLTFRCGASGWLGGDYSLRTTPRKECAA